MFITYAQNREDAILDAYFKDVKNGFYIDIGANHPIHDSITKHFYSHGWTGVNVEPIEDLHKLLLEDRPLDTNLQVGISSKRATLTLRQYTNTGLSTFSDNVKSEHSHEINEKTDGFKDVKIKTITLKDLFEKYVPDGRTVHFLKIDVEGLENDVIISNDWKKNRPEIICIEVNHTTDEAWRAVLSKNKYELAYFDGLNEYYLANEASSRASNFSFVDTLLLDQQIMPYHVHDKLLSLEEELKNKEVALDIQAIHLRQLQKEKEILEKLIIEQRRFSSTVKMLFKSLDKLLIARIENLRGVKPSHVPLRSQEAKTVPYDTSGAQALLSTIELNDMAKLYSNKSVKRTERLFLYKTVKAAYKGTRVVIKAPVIVLRKVLKKGTDNK
jgi:FkbM family methyltransferase